MASADIPSFNVTLPVVTLSKLDIAATAPFFVLKIAKAGAEPGIFWFSFIFCLKSSA